MKPGLVDFGSSQSPNNALQGTLINASAMAKPFGKKPANWLRLSSTKQFLAGLGEVKNLPVANLIKRKFKKEADGEKGIWIHEDAALEFARWLSSSFAIWNNQRTKELLLTGKTETAHEDTLPMVASDLLVNKVSDGGKQKTDNKPGKNHLFTLGGQFNIIDKIYFFLVVFHIFS